MGAERRTNGVVRGGSRRVARLAFLILLRLAWFSSPSTGPLFPLLLAGEADGLDRLERCEIWSRFLAETSAARGARPWWVPRVGGGMRRGSGDWGVSGRRARGGGGGCFVVACKAFQGIWDGSTGGRWRNAAPGIKKTRKMPLSRSPMLGRFSAKGRSDQSREDMRGRRLVVGGARRRACYRGKAVCGILIWEDVK